MTEKNSSKKEVKKSVSKDKQIDVPKNRLVKKLLSNPKAKPAVEKKILKSLGNKIPKTFVKLAKPDNAAMMLLMQQSINKIMS